MSQKGAFSMPRQGTSHFHFTNACILSHDVSACHVCCFLGFSSFPDVSLLASCSPLCAFTIFPSLFLKFILPCLLLETQKHHIQDLNRNFSRVTFIFNHYFCPRLWHKFLEKNIDSVDYMSGSITTKTNPSTL